MLQVLKLVKVEIEGAEIAQLVKACEMALKKLDGATPNADNAAIYNFCQSIIKQLK